MSNEPRQILENLRRLQAVIDVLAWIASRFDKAVDALDHQSSIDDVIRELDEHLDQEFDRINQALLLILEKLPDERGNKRIKAQTDHLRRQTIESRITSLKNQLFKQQRNLNWYEEQAASYGPNTTIEITNSIIGTRERLKELNDEMVYLRSELDRLDK